MQSSARLFWTGRILVEIVWVGSIWLVGLSYFILIAHKCYFSVVRTHRPQFRVGRWGGNLVVQIPVYFTTTLSCHRIVLRRTEVVLYSMTDEANMILHRLLILRHIWCLWYWIIVSRMIHNTRSFHLALVWLLYLSHILLPAFVCVIVVIVCRRISFFVVIVIPVITSNRSIILGLSCIVVWATIVPWTIMSRLSFIWSWDIICIIVCSIFWIRKLAFHPFSSQWMLRVISKDIV